MRDGQATRRRLLDAATAEFAAYGIAGARVDRIVADARTNKAQMYGYYESKDGLFDAVFGEHLSAILDVIPLDATDLAGYAAAIYDTHLQHPEFVRLAAWARLERTPTGELLPITESRRVKLDAIAAAQRSGHIDSFFEPVDVLATVVAVAMTWSPISITDTASRHDDPSEHQRRRNTLAEIVRHSFTPAQPAVTATSCGSGPRVGNGSAGRPGAG